MIDYEDTEKINKLKLNKETIVYTFFNKSIDFHHVKMFVHNLIDQNKKKYLHYVFSDVTKEKNLNQMF